MTETRIQIRNEQPQTPAEEPTKKIEFAGVSERFVALLIDYGVIFLPLQLVASLVLNQVEFPNMWNAYIGAIVGINLVFILYEAFFSCGERMTLGKALVGIAVVKQDLSGPISFGRAFLRAVGYYVSGALCFCGFLWAFIDDRHRAWHDFLGGSVVVQVREKSALEKFLLRAVGALLLAAFAYVIYFQLFGGRNWQEKHQIRQAEQFLEKVALLERAHHRLYGSYTNDYLRLVLLSGDPVQFQRDSQKYLSNKDFKIGVTKDSYKISARAKDKNKTKVYYTFP